MVVTPSRRPTMRDVARRAGVSFKTVSRVVNDETGVSSELVGRVEKAVTQLGYRPDDRARRLRQRGSHTGTIGFVLVDVANPFFSSILRGIEEVARHRGSLVLAGSSDGLVEREHQLVGAFIARRVDGLVVVSVDPTASVLRQEIERGTPVVFLDLETRGVRADLVRSDHRGGARAATAHLLAAGHRDIAFFGDDPAIFSAKERRAGFRQAMRAAGIDVPVHRIVTGAHPPDAWRGIMTDYLRRPDPPTAIFTAQNFVTLGAARALHELSLQHRIAQIGFDDVELADLVEPGISVVPQQPFVLGGRAAELLFERIGGADHPAVREIVRCNVVARGSGELPPDPLRTTGVAARR